MNYSGDAAEQIVKMSLEGVEVAARITGSAAKEIAVMLIAALKNNDKNLKIKGKARLNSMLKSGKALDIFSVKQSDLQKFIQGAKDYGIVYCVLRNTKNDPDGLCDIFVKAEDSPKISRLAERFKFATVDRGRIKSEIVAERAERTADTPSEQTLDDIPEGAEPEAPDKDDIEKLLDELLGTDEGKTAPDTPEAEITEPSKAEAEKSSPDLAGKEQPDSPPFGRSEPPTPLPSEPTSGSRETPEKAISSKPSVKVELREITAARKAKESDTPKRGDRPETVRPKNAPTMTMHKQPQNNKQKYKKSKGSR